MSCRSQVLGQEHMHNNGQLEVKIISCALDLSAALTAESDCLASELHK